MSRSRRRRERRGSNEVAAVEARPVALEGVRSAIVDAVKRRPVMIAVAFALLHVALGLLTFEPRPHTGGDNAAYITLATSLLERGEYRELWDPAEPPHTKYPPVFPGILAIALALGLKPFVQLKLVVLAMSATAVAFSFLWLRARSRPVLAATVALLLAVAPGVLREGRWLLSDVPFWCFTMIALWAFERLRPDDWRRFGVGLAAVVLAYFTRSAGLPLALAALAWLGWRGHWRQLVVLAVAVGVPAIAWWLRSRAFGPAGYVSEFWLINPYQPELGTIGVGGLIARIGENIARYVSIHLPILMAGGQSIPILLASIAIAVAAVTGWVRHLIRWPSIRMADLFIPLYLGLILIWPAVWSGERFLLPALPLLLFFAGDAAAGWAHRLAGRQHFVAAATAVALLVMLAAPALANGLRTGSMCTAAYRAGDRFACLEGPHWQDFFAMAETTGQVLPEDAVVLNRKPRLFYVLSGLRGANYPLSTDVPELFRTVQATGARYVVFDRLDAVSDMYLRPALVGRPDSFCIMFAYERTGTVLFGIRSDEPRAPVSSPVDDAAAVGFELCGDEYWRSPSARDQFTVPPGP